MSHQKLLSKEQSLVQIASGYLLQTKMNHSAANAV